MTQFPHAVLEIKLALEPGVDPPAWVGDLVASGALTEVHKFSKFMHGCAALFPDVTQEVPYWQGLELFTTSFCSENTSS
jgi:SPX domain protein involved in polyphosphate accumulation